MWMLWVILVETVVIAGAAIWFSFFSAHSANRRRDLRNCRARLAFLESVFAGATIGDLKMDELTASLRRVLAGARPRGE